jgi:hypothetical protein
MAPDIRAPGKGEEGAPAPPEDSCPVCDMVRKHEPGCPFEGTSMKEANRLYRDHGGARVWDPPSSPPGSR